ncbi:uncharacterized protein LOC110616941 isoform X2 [Manihot esculenta]|uniref:uncharacterized protein LOC110616941 isoform X2 n=1 Tax=Manihot esculenta TaxID=3983 RepID=UPI001CC4E333|nr:uncharacterized protein LOC110616941 isoform X2 [Manihot esculenta]
MLSLSASFHAPFVSIPPSRPSSSSSLSSKRSTTFSMSVSARIAVVGDVHDDWNLEEDTKALQLLQIGDFGNENVDLVQSVADLQFPKAVILGNHDSWCTQQFSQKYGIQDMDGSAVRIYNTALRTPENHLIIFLAHNGPTGLGSNLNDICGKDWVFGGGDHGDPDLAQAIAHLKETTRLNIPLVVFGHMHKELAHGNGLRKMIVISNDKTIYLNGAIVPRVKRINDDERSPSSSFMNSETSQLTSESRGTKRAFTVVEILEGRVDKIAETWVSVNGDVTLVEEEHVLFEGSN